MKAAAYVAALGLLAGWLAAGTGCETKSSGLPDGSGPEVRIQRVQPETLLPGSWVEISGQGFVDADSGSLTVLLERGAGEPWQIAPERIDDNQLRFRLLDELFRALGGPGDFQGMLRVRLDLPGGAQRTDAVPVSWELVEQLEPRLDYFSAAVGQEVIYLGSQLDARGSGFLLQGEGTTELRLNGTFTPADSGESEPVVGNLILLDPQDRSRLAGPMPPSGFGIRPGVFSGQVVPVNVHRDGPETPGPGLTDVSLELGPTFLMSFEPEAAGRGQWIDFYGRGFTSGSATTVVRIEGTFTERSGTVVDLSGENALQIVPEVISGEHMRYVLRVVADGQGGVTGLGAEPGVLRATATPVVYYGAEEQPGFALDDVEFEVLAQKQVVFISYLPGFTDTLRRFGLRNVEEPIRNRIRTVVDRDYAEFNVEFRSVRPSDYLEYAVIEIGGEDPNGRDLLGLDNTMGKDTGNLYFDDVVGGMNADSRESGTYAFGGVFVASYLLFSPSEPGHMPIASARFDDIFAPFMPDRGGQPVEAGEYPDGARGAEIELAIHALGSMIGNTISHEIGHTLGLASGPPDLFHNNPPAPNQIMDAGAERSFEERAEIDGQGPASWTAENRAYLLQHLPK